MFVLSEISTLSQFYNMHNLLSRYMLCLKETGQKNNLCREQARDYLGCRMDKGLMAKEEWPKLGYADISTQTPPVLSSSNQSD